MRRRHFHVQAAAQFVGYLVTTFQTDTTGGVFQHLSIGNDPYNFRPLNNSLPVFTNTVGSLGLRDPFLVVSPDRRDYWVLGTDLDPNKTKWKDAEAHGSHSIIVSHSKDLVTWEPTYPLKLEDDQAGFLWAPSALWSPKENKYIIFWTANQYAAADKDHKNIPKESVVRFATTTDFKTVTTATKYTELEKHEAMLDQEFLPLDNGQYLFFATDTTDKVTFGLAKTSLWGGHWQTGRLHIKGGAGPTAFRDNVDPNKLRLWVDKWKPMDEMAGYEAYEAQYDGIEAASANFTSSNKDISPTGLRHGSVTPLTQAEYDRLDQKYPKGKK